MKSIEPPSETKPSIAKADREYCMKCVYANNNSIEVYLCNYISITGQRRGCKYGVGCTKRKEKTNDTL